MSESNDEDVEEAQPTTDLEAVMDSLVTLSTSVASLQSQVSDRDREGGREEIRPSLNQCRIQPILVRTSSGSLSSPAKCPVLSKILASPPSNRKTEDRELAQQAMLG